MLRAGAIFEPDALAHLAASVQPLVFETGISEAPYSTRGTTFLVGYEGRVFVLTARHSLRPDNIPPVCIFPSDSSRRILPLRDVFFVSSKHFDGDLMDLAVIEVDQAKITGPELGLARIIDLALAGGDWLSLAEKANLFVIGFPEEHSEIDYDQEIIRTERRILHGRYLGPSTVSYLHELAVYDTLALTTFSGFSGAPVFASIDHTEGPQKIFLCGMVLRGTPTSKRIHFLDQSVLLDAIMVKCAKT